MSRPCGTWIRPRRTRRSGRRPWMYCPAKSTVPRRGRTSPDTVRNSVDFPEPVPQQGHDLSGMHTQRDVPQHLQRAVVTVHPGNVQHHGGTGRNPGGYVLGRCGIPIYLPGGVLPGVSGAPGICWPR